MKVSIITPVYNAEKSIERTIKSIIRQKEFIFEYIIIDGGSKDKTLEVISKFKNDVDVIVSEKDKGIADAYNKGIDIAKGDLIGIIAADDQLINNAISELIKRYDGISDVICGNIIDFNGIRYRRRSSNKDLERLKKGTTLIHPATFIRKDSYIKYGFYSLKYKCAIDRELFLRFYKRGAKFQIEDIDISLFASGEGISTINPCIYAYPEDCRISIEYETSEVKAKTFLYFSIIRYYLQKLVKYIIRSCRINIFFNKWMVKKGKFISEDDIRRFNFIE